MDRDVIFLAEAFTRRAVMRELAKLGFTQSYTYFTWKTSRHELTEYVNELAHTEEREYFRPNFFPVTPDILEAYLVHGGPGRVLRAARCWPARSRPSYGIYSGYEHYENVPVREGSEEYLNSEKYETWERKLDGPLLPVIRRLNEIRRDNPALQLIDNVHFLETHNDALIAYVKHCPGNTVIIVVSLDPFGVQEGSAVIPAELGLPPVFAVEDLLTGEHFDWRLGGNFVRMEAGQRQAHILRVVGMNPSANDPGHWFEASPLWFKTAVFYEIHTRAFFDANGDGSGDFRGLTEKLDYLQWLGVDCIWLLPFFESPLRDGGYDISDFFKIQPDYGTVDDVRDFIEAAHQRGIRVIADLVMNHTSSRPPVVPGVALVAGQPQARLVRVVGHRPQATRTPGSSSRTPRPPTGPGTSRPARTSGTGSSPTSRTSTSTTPRSRRRCSRSCASGWTWAWTGSGSTRCRTCSSARAPTARTCPRRTSTSSACARRSTPTTRTACCWPRRTSGRPTSSSTSATATSARWRSTSRSCRACSWRCGARRRCRSTRSCATRRRSPTTASGGCSCATTTS